MERCNLALAAHPWRVLFAAVLLGVPLLWGAGRLQVSSSVEQLVPPDTPARRFYHHARATFGSEEVDIIGLVADGPTILTGPALERVRRISDRAAALPGVLRVISPTTVPVLEVTPQGIQVHPLLESRRHRGAIVSVRRGLLRNPLAAGMVVSPDGKAAAVIVVYQPMSEQAYARRGYPELLRGICAGEPGPGRCYFSGLPLLKAEATRRMVRDLTVFLPLALVLAIAVLYVALGSARAVVIALVVDLLGLGWTLGLMGWSGAPLTVTSLVLPSLLLAIGGAYVIHVLTRYLDLSAEVGPREGAAGAVRECALAMVVTAATTAVGFAALAAYPVEAIAALGRFAVAGVVIIFFASLTLVPALGQVVGPRTRGERAVGEGWLGRWLARLAGLAIHRRRAVFAGTLVVLCVFAAGIGRVRVDTNYVRYFDAGSEVRVATDTLARHFGGLQAFYVVVSGPGPDALVREGVLGGVDRLTRFIGRLGPVVRVVSVTDLLRAFDTGLRGEGASARRMGGHAAAQLMTLLGPKDLQGLVSPDLREANIVVRTRFLGSREAGALVAAISDYAARIFPPRFRTQATGAVVLLDQTADRLASGQVTSFGGTLLVVYAVMAGLFLSLRLGLVAMAPNLIPIVLFFGVLGWSGTPLSLSTAMIASIALGLGVDEAIHLLAAFSRTAHRSADEGAALRQAVVTAGRPSVINGVALVGALLIPGFFSSFAPVRAFGLLTAFTVAASLVADLVVTPALLSVTRVVTLWDLVFVRLGGAPQEAIPLLAGLRAYQARIAVLMGRLRSLPAGAVVVRRGEPGEEMFVVLRGSVEVRLPQRGEALAKLGRGEVLGEMGLIRREPRSADVVTLEPTDLLVVDARFLARLRRYPRIGAAVFRNLTRILSDRLARATDALVGGVSRSGLTALALVLMTFAAGSAAGSGPQASALLQDAYDLAPGAPFVARARITTSIQGRPGPEREFVLRSQPLPEYTAVLVEVSAPFHLRGTRFLFWDRPVGRDQQFFYVPAVGRSIEVSAGMRAQAFLNSDFLVTDLTRPDLAAFRHRLLAPMPCCARVESLPLSVAASPYGRIISWIAKDSGFVVKTELFDRLGRLEKVWQAERLERYQGQWTVWRQRMESRREPRASTIELLEIEYGVSFAPEDFSRSALQR